MLQQARARKQDGYDIVVGVVETHGRKETRGPAGRARGRSPQAPRIQGAVARGDGSRRHHRPPPADRAGRRARPYQRARQPSSQALSRRRGTAQPRHRRLHHRQHPAHRESERRRRADHACSRARDRAGFGVRPRRCHRARRSHPRRPDRAAQGRQGLRPQAGRACAGALLFARQPDRLARACAAPHRGARGRAIAHAYAGPCHPGAVGGGRAHSGLRQRGSARRRASCATPSAWPTGCMRRLRRLCVETRRSLQWSEDERDRVADTLRLAEALGGEAITVPGGSSQHRRRRGQLRAGQQRHADHHRKIDAVAMVRDPARLGRA